MGMNERQNRTVLFVHIPKTGGTTLRVLFQQQYPQQATYIIAHGIQNAKAILAKQPPGQRARYGLIFGHMCWGWHQFVPAGRAYAYTTMLREPIERTLSLFSHCRLKEHYLGAALKGKDIEYFLTSGVTMRADNAMVRQLCGRDAFIQQGPWKDMVIPLGGVTRDDLEAAKENLRKCALVGVMEEFDAYLEAGKREFGWRFGGYRKENQTRWARVRQENLSNRQRAAVEKSNELDRELYEFAVELSRGQR